MINWIVNKGRKNISDPQGKYIVLVQCFSGMKEWSESIDDFHWLHEDYDSDIKFYAIVRK